MSNNKLILGAVAAVAALAVGGYAFSSMNSGAQGNLSVPAAAQAEEANLLPDIPLGSAQAPITVIEYASYTCPHCATFHDTVFDKLKAEYIDTGKVQFIHREVYFDAFGLKAAQVANCGGVTKYYPINDMIYSTQGTWIGDGDPATITENLKKIGLKAGLTSEAIDACMSDDARAEQMVATFQARAEADDVQGTPTLIIDGEKNSNMSYADLKAILDAKLAQ
ncbi:DsbA family protein [Albirhodobacter sp. R86504]|uniref:DsbA family protein n=1 Tax=Albirhodobacter sp. R86504 TaxID=3093848 RepID=UPI003672A607